MRLPWPFDRWNRDAGAADGEAAGVDAGALAPGESTRPAPPTGAWATLPPIQRSVGEPPLVAPSSPFLAGVPGARALPPIVEPLGHDVGPLAPAGVVAARAHPVASLTSSSSLVRAPVQRRAAASAEDVAGVAPFEIASDGPDRVASATLPPSASPLPVRRVGIVPDAAVATPPSRPLTRAEPTGPVGGPPLGRSGRSAVAQRDVTVPAGRPGSAATPSAAMQSPFVVPPAASVPSDASPPVTPARRPGLGAPLAGPPPNLVRTPPATPIGASTPSVPSVARSTAPTVPRMPPATAGSAPPASKPRFRAASGSTPPGPAAIQREASALSPAGSPEVPAAELPPSSPPSPPARHASLPVLPVARMASPSAVGSAPGGKSSGGRPAERSTADSTPLPAPATEPVRRPLVGRRPSIATTPVQRRADGAAADDGGPAQSAAAMRATNPVEESREASVHAGTAWPIAQAGGAAVRTSPGGLVPPAAAHRSPARPGAAMPPLGLAGVQRTPATGAAQPSEEPVGGAIVAATPAVATSPSPAPVLGPTATAVVQRVDGAAPAPPPAEEGHSDHELDELARKLFGRFQNRLRAEFIYEREAKGLTFDS